MEPSVAIAYIEMCCVDDCDLCSENQKHGGECHGFTLVQEALEIAISALQKQIPKKPLYQETNWAYKRIDCPICNNHISFQMPNQHPKDVYYCNKCGQAIDWSDYNGVQLQAQCRKYPARCGNA